LYSDSIVAIDVKSGTLKWHFQNTPHDVHDWDSLEAPVLIDATFRGQPRKLVVQANRNGFYYVLDRTNGAFLLGTPFVDQLDWATGLDAKAQTIVTPGHDPTVKGTKTLRRRWAQRIGLRRPTVRIRGTSTSWLPKDAA
jgi:alcohol dehydrogenase (cytochrome c)